MMTLAIDTTNATCGVAVADGERILYEAASSGGMQHAAQLLPMIQTALAACALVPEDIRLCACAVGPGSFTGVRIGVSAARGLAFATGMPCAAVNALEALAHGIGGAITVPMFDARRGQVYAAAFANGERVLPDAALDAEEMLALAREMARALNLPLYIMGEGAVVNAARLAAPDVLLAPPNQHAIRPSAVALLGQAAPHIPGQQLKPYYLRPSQAERERAAREGSS